MALQDVAVANGHVEGNGMNVENGGEDASASPAGQASGEEGDTEVSEAVASGST